MVGREPEAKTLEELITLIKESRKLSQAERIFLRSVRATINSDCWGVGKTLDHELYAMTMIPEIDRLLGQ